MNPRIRKQLADTAGSKSVRLKITRADRELQKLVKQWVGRALGQHYGELFEATKEMWRRCGVGDPVLTITSSYGFDLKWAVTDWTTDPPKRWSSAVELGCTGDPEQLVRVAVEERLQHCKATAEEI